MFRQYGVPKVQWKIVVTALQEHVDDIYADTYDAALHAEAELLDIRGYKMTMEEVEDVAAEMLVTTMLKE